MSAGEVLRRDLLQEFAELLDLVLLLVRDDDADIGQDLLGTPDRRTDAQRQRDRVTRPGRHPDTVAEKRFEVAKNRYVIGKIGVSDLYIAQNEKDQALDAYVQALRSYWANYYRLRRVTLYDFVEKSALQ